MKIIAVATAKRRKPAKQLLSQPRRVPAYHHGKKRVLGIDPDSRAKLWIGLGIDPR